MNTEITEVIAKENLPGCIRGQTGVVGEALEKAAPLFGFLAQVLQDPNRPICPVKRYDALCAPYCLEVL